MRDATVDSGQIDVACGGRLRELRIEAGLTHEELACGVGLSFRAVLEHESGQRRMKPAEIVRYTRFLGVGLSAFVVDPPADNSAHEVRPTLYQIWP